jgi:nucleoside-diphosphate-sugar epimerase
VRILLTGATGFVGSEVLRQLLAAQHETAILVRKGNDPWRITTMLDHVRRIESNDPAFRDASAALADFQPEGCLHLAWDGVASGERDDPKQSRNVALTSATLELARVAGVKHWIGLGSQAEHGRPITRYGTAKLASAMLAKRYCERYGIRFGWLRLFAAYGPAENPEWLVPYVILCLLSGKHPRLTAGEQRRDYLFVRDAARAIIALMERPRAAGIFDLGSGRAVKVRVLVETIRDTIDPALPLRFGEVPYGPEQRTNLEAAIGSLAKATGWQPTTSLADGLIETVRYYRENRGPC